MKKEGLFDWIELYGKTLHGDDVEPWQALFARVKKYSPDSKSFLELVLRILIDHEAEIEKLRLREARMKK